jgi:hypothetical protein
VRPVWWVGGAVADAKGIARGHRRRPYLSWSRQKTMGVDARGGLPCDAPLLGPMEATDGRGEERKRVGRSGQ